ncbi:hypothetical protein FJR04_00130 [Anabaena sp. UHCC 0204]|nr:hypothetical protein [Anabaena sp. UHCC 0204]
MVASLSDIIHPTAPYHQMLIIAQSNIQLNLVQVENCSFLKGNREQGTGNREQGTGNRKRVLGDFTFLHIPLNFLVHLLILLRYNLNN